MYIVKDLKSKTNEELFAILEDSMNAKIQSHYGIDKALPIATTIHAILNERSSKRNNCLIIVLTVVSILVGIAQIVFAK